MDRFAHISPFIVMDVLDRARKMEGVVHLEVGEPDLEAPPAAIEAFERAVRDGRYRYTPALGLMELREKIAGYYYERYGVAVSPERVAVTPGTSGAFLVVYAMLLDPGDRIALSDPSYPCYRNFAYLLGIEPVFIPVSGDGGYCISPGMLEHHEKVGVLQISNPSNPTGNIYRSDALASLVEYAGRHGIALVSDEIYHGLVYDEKEHSVLEYDDEAIVINGFSKYFCMPGFRVGWMIMPERYIRRAEMVLQNIFIAANTPAQYAALEAFDGDYLSGVRDTFRERRDFLHEALKDVFDVPVRPEGAFYLWADVGRYGLKGVEFSDRLLKEERVAVTPGVDFGKNGTETFVRLAFTSPLEDLRTGVERIRRFVSCLQK